MLDMLITGGTVIDGSGAPGFRADLAIADGRIVQISTRISGDASRRIDARGLHICPGFIDPHTHSEEALVVDPKAESKVRQGVTTEVVGNCGGSPAPLLGAALAETQGRARAWGLTVDWTTMAQYIERLRKQGTALNVVPLVGHNTVRECVLGADDVQPSLEQQAAMERLVSEAMEQGARGLSSGLYYPPGFYAKTEEVIGVARAAGRYGGIYATHIRSESDGLREAIDEALRIGEQAKVRVEIAHVKLEGFRNWEGVEGILGKLDAAEARGLRVGCDQYPYVASSTWLAAVLPYWAQAGGAKAVAKRCADRETRAQLKQDYRAHREDWENRGGVKEWGGILVTECEGRHEVEGKNIAEIADADRKDPLDTLWDLIAVSDGQGSAVWFDQDEEIVRSLMKHPLVVVGSDGYAISPQGILGQGKPHPRSYGTFPRVLGRYVREEKVLGLEEAVKKMTSATAERYGVADRGVLRAGAWADVVLVDASQVIDRATYSEPHQFPTGMPYVIVNGVVVVDQGRHTGKLPGRVL